MVSTTERRQHERTEIELAATVERISGRPLAVEAVSVDLSDGGACLVAPAGFNVGDVVNVTVGDGEVAIRRQGLIVGRQGRSDKKVALNIAFKILDGHDPADVRRMLQARTG